MLQETKRRKKLLDAVVLSLGMSTNKDVVKISSVKSVVEPRYVLRITPLLKKENTIVIFPNFKTPFL